MLRCASVGLQFSRELAFFKSNSRGAVYSSRETWPGSTVISCQRYQSDRIDFGKCGRLCGFFHNFIFNHSKTNAKNIPLTIRAYDGIKVKKLVFFYQEFSLLAFEVLLMP